jgi:hypothetical protein
VQWNKEVHQLIIGATSTSKKKNASAIATGILN